MQDFKLKQLPEDFKVYEESRQGLFETGDYSIWLMQKRNCTTEDAVQAISRALSISRKAIGYAGTKDSRAVSWQRISLRGVARESIDSLNIKNVNLRFLGWLNGPLHLGELDGNRFEITVRNITRQPSQILHFVNYFGPQRFSVNNAEIGKCILKKEFRHAVELVMMASHKDGVKISEHLAKSENDFVGALKALPWKNLQMYVHAYQSKLWNRTAETISRSNHDNKANLAILGFSTYFIDEHEKKAYSEILEDEGFSLSDFVVRAIPELTSDGGERSLYAEVKDLEIGGLDEDELNPGKKKCLVKFSLGKGSYATVAVKEMLSQS